MQEIDKIIRAWKDDDYLMSLNADEQQALPVNPAGLVEISGADINHAAGTFTGYSAVFILYYCL
jgi:mersacidin/lichenicidin family type 2 lantibiotic